MFSYDNEYTYVTSIPIKIQKVPIPLLCAQSSPPLPKENTFNCFIPWMSFASYRTLYICNNAMCTLLRNISFTQQNGFETHPYFYVLATYLFFYYCRTAFYCMNILQFVNLFSSGWILDHFQFIAMINEVCIGIGLLVLL